MNEIFQEMKLQKYLVEGISGENILGHPQGTLCFSLIVKKSLRFMTLFSNIFLYR